MCDVLSVHGYSKVKVFVRWDRLLLDRSHSRGGSEQPAYTDR